MRGQPFTLAVVALLLFTTTGCDNTNAPSTGALQVSLVTTGGDLDLNGYTATLDSGVAPLTVPANGSVVIPDLPTGSRDVTLGDVAANCTLTGSNPRTITVVGGDTTAVVFEITCVATGVRVTTTTSGVDLDLDGYAIAIDGVLASVVGTNGSVEITRLAAGSHTVALNAVSANCPVAGGATKAVTIGLGEIGPVAFDVTCLAVTGAIEVRAATAGIDFDTDGYTVQLDNGSANPLGINGVVRFQGLAAGGHTITFGGAAANCAPVGDNPRTVSVTTGGAKRDTARTTFTVGCVGVTGVIEVTAATTGVELDPDGYTVQVDGDTARPIARNATARYERLSGGDHTVTLAGAAGNCSIGGDNPRTVHVSVGGATRDTARTTFAVTCLATTGVLKITTTTTGTELDPDGYGVYVDENCYGYYGYYCYYTWSGTIGANSAVVIPGLSFGEHTLRFDGLDPNCAFSVDPPATVTVPRGDTVVVSLAVTCLATGHIQVAATTTGADLDPDGYSVVASKPGFSTTASVAANGTITFNKLLPGDYQVTFNGVAPNCVLTPPNPRTVTVTAGETAVVAVDVACSALGTLQVAASTTGTDLDPNGYTVLVSRSGFSTSRNVGDNEAVGINGLVAGDYDVTLSGMAGNCTVMGLNPRIIAVPSGATAAVTFDVVCTPLARIQVTATTTGVDLDPNGYAVVLSGPGLPATSYDVPSNGIALIGPILPGDYEMTLTGIALNCDGGAPNPRTVTAAAGDTAKTQFDVGCTTAGELAIGAYYSGNTDVYRVKSNGTNPTRLTTALPFDGEPAWSPNGSKIAFTSVRDGNQEIYVMDATGSNQVRLTNTTAIESHPAWSPDGSKIAFMSERDGNREIYVMNADGSNPMRLTNNTAIDDDPAWSPDGTTIAFSSNRDGNFEIYTMDASGVGTPLRLTNNSVSDLQPDWSPDGQRLVFSRFTGCYSDYYGYSSYCDYDLYIMDANGSNVVQLTSGYWSVDVDPAWSPDGQWIAFGAQNCQPYYGCSSPVVNAVKADGSRLTDVARDGSPVDPSWRRP